MSQNHFLPILLCIICLTGCGEKIEPGTAEPHPGGTVTAETGRAEISARPLMYEALGTVTAKIKSTLSGKIMGTVRAVNIREGDRVKQGDILVVLDTRQVEAGLQQAEAGAAEARRAEAAALSALESARAGEKLAETTFKRYRMLLREKSVSRQAYDEAETKYQQAKSLVRQAEAMLAAARSRVKQAEAGTSFADVSRKDASIPAPYDGIVTARMVDEGDLASPGTPFLILEKSGGFEAELMVPEYHIHAVRRGQNVPVSIAALGREPLQGSVKTIVPSADTLSRTFMVKVTLPEQEALRSGMFARGYFPVGEDRLILIPTSALVQRGQLSGFFLVDDKGRARFRLLRTGRTFGDETEVISGMKSGMPYVINPPEELQDGVKVEDLS
ncbi:MAG: efflux RND transporter periplasmic adaptor subunit [Desulfococcaceae bacterium]|nr:efflux RND transporter periplasmic adaptor subunit [Desulfococcaceae bacterium]